MLAISLVISTSEAGAAEYGPVVSRLKGYLGFLAAFCTDDSMQFPGAATAFPALFDPASGAAFGLVGKALLCEEFLLP